jgi:plastocyanin
MNEIRLTRRRLLQGTAGVAAVGLAGCTGSPETTAGDGTSDGSSGDGSSDGSGGDEDPPGHGESEHSHGSVGEPKDEAEVLVNTARGPDNTEYHFKPHVTRVSVGGTVTWTLESGSHTATAYHPDNDEPQLVPDGTEAWDSGTLEEEGETFEHTFETEGVYHYLCKPHEQFGMLATVIVGDPHLDDQVALNSIPENKPDEVRGKIEELNGMVRSALEDDHSGGSESEGHHDDGTATEDGHHDDGTETEDGHHDDGTATEDGHHDDGTATEDGHHDDGTETEDGHHDG